MFFDLAPASCEPYDRCMSVPKVFSRDYIEFLIGTPKVFSGTEAARARWAARNKRADGKIGHFAARRGSQTAAAV